jgi:hypothetical protein
MECAYDYVRLAASHEYEYRDAEYEKVELLPNKILEGPKKGYDPIQSGRIPWIPSGGCRLVATWI